MNPIEALSSVFRNYANFKGRAQRSEFWWFTLFAVVSQSIANFIPFVGGIYSLALLLPSLAVTARRLHDTDRSAWWLILFALGILAWIVGSLLVILAFASFFTYSWVLEWNDESSVAFQGAIALAFLVLFVICGLATITLLVLCALPGTAGQNRFGPDPLRTESGAQTYGSGSSGSVPAGPPPPGGYTAAGEPARAAPSGPQPASASGQRGYCSHCGEQLQRDARFCTYCGNAV